MNLVIDRVIIRRFKDTDFQDLYEYLSDEEVVQFEPYEIFTKEEAKEEAIRRTTDDNFYAVCLKESGKLIGNLYLAESDFNTFEIGYVFNKEYQGKGYAYESGKALLEYAFSNLGARRVIGMCSTKNTSSWKLLERFKMRREGLLLQNVYFKKDDLGEPIWFDTYEYAILKSEWIL